MDLHKRKQKRRKTMDKNERRQFVAAILIVFISVASIMAIGLAFRPPAYEFKTGVTHPQEISNLLKNGTVVLLFTQDHCADCMKGAQIMADLQSQYNGTNVTFARFNAYDNTTTSLKMFKDYDIRAGIDSFPQIFVIRGDGAVAKFTYKTIDISLIKSAIEDAQNWQQSHPMQSP
jgi:thiol-disulfide isomerase/thioredoxin